ncbi:MAG: tRNA (cytidine(34)-2'-O)-methyltransferase [Elusimicrobia bacterium]|nr:tRNA (cytidine(34)-2'-O)-methyltransferase [Elusimicrobiota bacterium]
MNVVLLEPEIHWNTGNIGRTCLGLGATLHLVEPLGFSLDAKEVKRAGLDYWDRVDLRVHKGWGALVMAIPAGAPMIFFSAEARQDFWEAPYEPGCVLVFGKESTGLPADMRKRHADSLYRIPHSSGIRSLNLSTAAGIVMYEAARQMRVTPRRATAGL